MFQKFFFLEDNDTLLKSIMPPSYRWRKMQHPTLPEHLSSFPVFSGIRFTRSLDLV